MDGLVARVALYIPTLIPGLFIFVFLVAASTVAFLLWRASRGPWNS